MLGKQLRLTDRLTSLKRNLLPCTGTLRARAHQSEALICKKSKLFKHDLRMRLKGFPVPLFRRVFFPDWAGGHRSCDRRELDTEFGHAVNMVDSADMQNVAVNRSWRPILGFQQPADARQCVVRMDSLQGIPGRSLHEAGKWSLNCNGDTKILEMPRPCGHPPKKGVGKECSWSQELSYVCHRQQSWRGRTTQGCQSADDSIMSPGHVSSASCSSCHACPIVMNCIPS